MNDFFKLHEKTKEDLKKYNESNFSKYSSEEEIRSEIKSTPWPTLYRKYLEKEYDPQDSELCEELGYSFENYKNYF